MRAAGSGTASASGDPDLAEHYADGRLDTEEHDERLDAIWSARTRADLGHACSGTCPGWWPRPRGLPDPYAVRASWRAPLTMFLVAALVLAVALEVPWWVWLIGLVVLLKSRHWRHRGHRRARATLLAGGSGPRTSETPRETRCLTPLPTPRPSPGSRWTSTTSRASTRRSSASWSSRSRRSAAATPA